jgi:hypothetical protein
VYIDLKGSLKMIKDLTLITCSYNTPDIFLTMLQSFVSFHGDGPHNIIVLENSTEAQTSRILDMNLVPFIRNPGGKHSESIDVGLQKCNTKYALLCDSDIIFVKNIEPLLNTVKTYNGALMGMVCASRGGYTLYPRVHPWFCFIDVEKIKENNIKFHDQERIDKTNSSYFYNSPPIHPGKGNTEPFYDVGATFYEDINKAGLKIINASGIQSFFIHAEGFSWHRTSGHEGFVKFGEMIYQIYQKKAKEFEKIDIKGKFIYE